MQKKTYNILHITNTLTTYFSPFSFSSSSKYEYSRHDSKLYLQYQKMKKKNLWNYNTTELLNYTQQI